MMKKSLHLMDAIYVILIFACISLLSCAGSTTSSNEASGPVSPSSMPVAVEFLDGASGVDTDASFQYQFPQEMDSTTISTSTFYIVEGSDANIAAPLTKSAPASALPATVTTTTDSSAHTSASLFKTDSALTCGTQYTLYVTSLIKTEPTPSSTTGYPYKGKVAPFTTKNCGEEAGRFFSGSSLYGHDILPTVDDAITPLAITFTTENTDTNNIGIVSLKNSSINKEETLLPGTWTYGGTDGTDTRINVHTPTSAFGLCDTIAAKINRSLITVSSDIRPRFSTQYTYEGNDFHDSIFGPLWDSCWFVYREDETNYALYAHGEHSSLDIDLDENDKPNGLLFRGRGELDMRVTSDRTLLSINKVMPYATGYNFTINFSDFQLSSVGDWYNYEDTIGFGVTVAASTGQDAATKSVTLYSYTGPTPSQSSCSVSTTESGNEILSNNDHINEGIPNMCDFTSSNNSGSIKILWDGSNITFHIAKGTSGDFTQVGSSYALVSSDVNPGEAVAYVSLAFFYKGKDADETHEASSASIRVDSLESFIPKASQ